MLSASLFSCSDDDGKSQKSVYGDWGLTAMSGNEGTTQIATGEYTWELDKAESTLTVSENFENPAHAERLLPDGVYAVEMNDHSIEVVTEGFEEQFHYTIRNGKLEINLPGPKTSLPAPPDLLFESL